MQTQEARDVQRLHIRSTVAGVDHGAATTWCLQNGRSGMGWRLHKSRGTATWIEYVESTGHLNTNVRRFHDLGVGTLLWTREPSGEYWLGEVKGEWEYLDNAAAREFDLFCTRPTKWIQIGTEEKVPGKVVNAFRSQRTLQRIGDPGARAYTNRIFARASSPDLELDVVDPDVVLRSLIGAEDLEDLVSVYLQVRYGYVLVSRFRSTPGYEYVLKGARGETIVASVKSGETPVSLDLLPADSADLAYVFSVSGTQVGSTDMAVETIGFDDLLEFMASSTSVLPNRVSAWL